jgi:hypothetical protein
MSLKKIINGKEIELSAEEEAQVLSEWNAYNNAKALYEATEKYKDDRKKEYPKAEDLIVALWEQIVENRAESAATLQQLRIAIKEKFQKPS